MKKIYLQSLVVAFLMLFSLQIKAQCISSNQFGSGTINSTVPGTSVTLTTCNYGGEYALATFSVTGNFIFSSNVSTDYITLTDNSNNIIGFGMTPLAATVPSVGIYRVHIAASAPPTCSVQNTCRVTSVLVPLLPCSGTPSAGVVPASYSICPNSSTNITATGATAASGIIYQWQESPNGTTWTNVTTGSGFNTASLTTTTLTALTYYRMVITCTSSAQSATTAVLSVNPNNPFSLCYCNTNLGGSGCSGDNITNVSILTTGLNNNSTCNSTPLNGTYSSFPPGAGTTATLVIGSTYSISVNTTASNIESLWIDYNQSGTFDASEHTQLTISSTASVPTVATFTVPLTALTGATGLRVRSRAIGNPNGPGDACTTFGSGEAEDYVVTLIPAVACSGSPFNLSLSGSTIASGLTYQWQSSPNNVTWTSIPSATTISTSQTISAVTYFRCIVACGTNTAASVSVQVNLMPAPFAGTISGPNNVVVNSNNTYTVSPVFGNPQWYQGTSPVGPWTLLTGATSSVTTVNSTPAGIQYYAVIASYPGCLSDTSNAAYSVTVTPMPGDNVCSAVTLTLGTSTKYYTLYGCTTQTGEVAPPPGGCSMAGNWCNSTLDNTRWFKFTAPASGYVSIQTPDFDSQVALWRASNCSNLLSASTSSLIAANDDDPNYTTNGGVMFSSFIQAGCLVPGATYYIQVDSYSPAMSSDSTRVIVLDMGSPLNASFTGLSSTYCLGAPASVLTPSVSGGTFTQNTSTVAITSFTPSTAGTYTVSYSIYGCQSNSVTVVSVCTGIESFTTDNGIAIYPNPTNGILNVNVSENISGASIEIMDAVGKTVLFKKLSGTQTTITISDLSSGLYIYRIRNNKELLKQGKLIKE